MQWIASTLYPSQLPVPCKFETKPSDIQELQTVIGSGKFQSCITDAIVAASLSSRFSRPFLVNRTQIVYQPGDRILIAELWRASRKGIRRPFRTKPGQVPNQQTYQQLELTVFELEIAKAVQ